MRITNQMLANRILANLDATNTRRVKIHEQMASGIKLARPSDDPVRVVDSLRFRSNLAETQQYLANISEARGWLEATDSALNDITLIVHRARELAVQGANGSLNQENLNAIAEEIKNLREEIIKVANTNHAGRYIFSGHQTQTPAFDTNGFWQGDSGRIQREVGPEVKIEINILGDLAIEPAIDALDQLGNNLLIGNQSDIGNVDLGALDASLETLLRYRAEGGAKFNRLEMAENQLRNLEVSLSRLRSDVEDSDLAHAAVELSQMENAYQVALAAAARIVQPTLLNFLR